MKQQWQQWSEKFTQLSPREITLIFISGIVLIFMVPFTFLIEKDLEDIKKSDINIAKLTQANKDADRNIVEFTQALQMDPNQALKAEINQLEKRIAQVDEKLLTLTEELIDPIEMRQALVAMLRLQKGVALTSFKVLPAEPLLASPTPPSSENNQNQSNVTVTTNNQSTLGLYRHAVQVTLTGKYFQLRDYLQQLEALPWTFYWHDFNYQLLEYPKSELKIEIYSLSTDEEFVGV